MIHRSLVSFSALVALGVTAFAQEPKFQSKVIDANTPGHAVEIDVDLTGAKELYLVVRDGELVTVPSARAKTDTSLNGYKKELKVNPVRAAKKADEIIRNTYRTLMSRGMKGCYVWFADEETAAYFREKLPSGGEAI